MKKDKTINLLDNYFMNEGLTVIEQVECLQQGAKNLVKNYENSINQN